METLEATAGGPPQPPTTALTSSYSTTSLSALATGGGSGRTLPAGDSSMMAQSMSGMLSQQFDSGEGAAAIDALNKTCSSLQAQVEQLQSSLSGVMQFMSAFGSFEIDNEHNK